MPLGSTIGPYYAVVLPVESTNLIENPSAERGALGWGTVGAGTVGTTSETQAFGAWAGSVAPTTMGTAGAFFGSWQAGNGTAYSVSAYIKGQSGVPYILAAGNTSNSLIGSVAFTGGGTWQRYSFSYTEALNTTRRIIVRKSSGNNTGAFYVDGLQVEVGSLTTYIDGGQPGCTWLGDPHNAPSRRDGQSRAGGSVVALADLGFVVDESAGIGLPPIENSSQSYALIDGAQYQRSRYAERPFTLASYMVGSSWQDLHTIRRRVIRALGGDDYAQQQPARLWYVGAGGTVAIDAVLDAGFEFGEPDGFTETAAVRFVAYDPSWYATTQEGTTLAALNSLGSVNNIINRSRLGAWGTLPSTSGSVRAFQAIGNTLYFGGDFLSANGVVSAGMNQYDVLSNTQGTLTGGTLIPSTGNRRVHALAASADGTLYVGGVFDGVQGTSSPSLIWWAGGAWGSFSGGTVVRNSANEGVYALLWQAGTLYFGGGFSAAGGTTNRFFGYVANGTFGSVVQTAGTINGDVWALGRGLDNTIYVGGVFGSAGGTAAARIAAFKNGAWGTVPVGIQNDTTNTLGGTVMAISVGANGVVYLAGQFGTAGSYAVANVAQYNGVQLTPLGSGVGTASTANQAYDVQPLGNGAILVGGRFANTGNRRMPDGIGIYNGYTYLPADFDLAGAQNRFLAAIEPPGGGLFIGGGFNTTGRAASVGTIVNTGRAPAYPTLEIYNTQTAGGTTRVYSLKNITTGDAIYFDLVMQPSERVTLTLTPGARSFVSSYLGTITGNIIGGSNLATWRLLPGTNYVSFFADTTSVISALYWTPRSMSADMGTIG